MLRRESVMDARRSAEPLLIPNVFDPVNRMFGFHLAPLFLIHYMEGEFYLLVNYPQKNEFDLYMRVIHAAQNMRHEVSSLIHKRVHCDMEKRMKGFIPDDRDENLIVVAFSFIFAVCHPESFAIFDLLNYRPEMKKLREADFTIKSSGPGFVDAAAYEQFKACGGQPKMVLLFSEHSDDYHFMESGQRRRFDA